MFFMFHGTDSHGTPITERAKKEGISPEEIVNHYHAEFVETFNKIYFSYDLYSKTLEKYHHNKVKEVFKKLYDNGYIYEKEELQAYCEHCNAFLQDREIQIKCPECGEITKGDQCDNCNYTPTFEDIEGGICLTCENQTVQKPNKNLYLALSKFQKEIEANTKKCKHMWRLNAINETEKYLKQGLKDRAVTRDLNWGIDVPVEGYENKRMYVWIDAVLGYFTDTMKICEENGTSWRDFWGEDANTKIYMSHGKDNIVFHSIILNGLLLGQEDHLHLVDVIVSTEYLNINDEKISKTKGNGITTLEMLDKYNPDSIRYYIINNGPERKDTNFTLDDFEKTHNTEILNKFGNLVNRTLRFKEMETLKKGTLDEKIEKKVDRAYIAIGTYIEKLEFKNATERIMELIQSTNKYYDDKQPWVQRKENGEEFINIIYNCAYVIANLSNLFEPFMPASCQKIRDYLNIEKPIWAPIDIEDNISLSDIQPLFERI